MGENLGGPVGKTSPFDGDVPLPRPLRQHGEEDREQRHLGNETNDAHGNSIKGDE